MGHLLEIVNSVCIQFPYVCFLVFFSEWYFYSICADVHVFIFCLNATVSIFPWLFFSVCTRESANTLLFMCVYVLPSVRRCSVPWAVASSRPSDYSCLLHRQINPVNKNNPSLSLSLSLYHLFTPGFSFILTHSLVVYNVTKSSAFLWQKSTGEIWICLKQHRGNGQVNTWLNTSR